MRCNKKAQFIILACIHQPVFAAETLEQVFTTALTNNQSLMASRSYTKAAEQNVYSAKGQRLPQLTASAGYTQLNHDPTAKTEVNGGNVEFQVSEAGSANAQVMLSMPVFTSGRISHDIEAAEAASRAAMQDEVTAELNIKWQMAQAFVAVFRAEKSLEVVNSHVKSLQAHSGDVKNLFEQGMVARNDLLSVGVELSNAQQAVLKAGNQLDLAKANFNQLMNRDLAAEVALVEYLPSTLKGRFDALANQALQERPELKVLGEQGFALEQRAASTEAGLWPQLNISGGYQYQQNSLQVYENMWSANATVNWKIYDGSTQHRSDELKFQSQALVSQKNDLKNAIQLQVRSAWLSVQETVKRIEISQQAIVQADENLKVSTERYQQGLANHTEVLDAENLRIRTHDNFNNARYDHSLANLLLRRAIGIL